MHRSPEEEELDITLTKAAMAANPRIWTSSFDEFILSLLAGGALTVHSVGTHYGSGRQAHLYNTAKRLKDYALVWEETKARFRKGEKEYYLEYEQFAQVVLLRLASRLQELDKDLQCKPPSHAIRQNMVRLLKCPAMHLTFDYPLTILKRGRHHGINRKSKLLYGLTFEVIFTAMSEFSLHSLSPAQILSPETKQAAERIIPGLSKIGVVTKEDFAIDDRTDEYGLNQENTQQCVNLSVEILEAVSNQPVSDIAHILHALIGKVHHRIGGAKQH